jgi:hypothetical protein
MLSLFCDRRIKPDRYYVAEEEDLMFVPKEVQQTVAFIYCNAGGERTPAGTAFFIGVGDDAAPRKDTSRMGWTYAVTARHVIEDIKRLADDSKVYFRLNRIHGTTEFVETDASSWISHPTDPMVDIAVLPWLPPFTSYEIKIIWKDAFGTESVIERDCVGTGDEVVITGLFSKHLGLGKNIPIIRIGNIAAMPGEPIETEVSGISGSMSAYLVEARSIGGLSGSPVFVNLGTSRKVGGKLLQPSSKRTDPGGVFYLIGLVHGHWDEVDSSPTFPLSDRRINMGIAIVVPIQKIVEVLDQPMLAERRAMDKESYMRKNKPTQDTALLARSVVEAAIGEPLTAHKKKKKTSKKGSKRVS